MLLRSLHYTIRLIQLNHSFVFDVCPIPCYSLILIKGPLIPCLLQSLGKWLSLKGIDIPLAVLRDPSLHPGDLILSHGLYSIQEGATIGCSQGYKLL